MSDYQLSASKLNFFREDPQAFWLEHQVGIKRPESIVAQITNGLDRAIKSLYDRHRGGLPPMLVGQVPGVLHPDLALVKKWRHWRSGLQSELTVCHDPDGRPLADPVTVRLIGALDDVLMIDGAVASLDTKTKGSASTTDGREWYELQGDVYELLFELNTIPRTGKSYWNHVWPVGCDDGTQVAFANRVFVLNASAERARRAIVEAVACLRSPAMPTTMGKYTTFADRYAHYLEMERSHARV